MKKSKLDFITVDEIKTGRKSSLGFGGIINTPACLTVVGGLSHYTEITFSKQQAKKLVKWLQSEIINKKD